MERNTLKLSSQLIGITPRADRTMTLRFCTQELSAEDQLIILQFLQKQGWLIFKEDGIADEEIPTEKSKYESRQTPSARLRNVIFKYWKEQKSNEYPDFETFYRTAIEKQIDAFKNKL